jgi:hypothetical protein
LHTVTATPAAYKGRKALKVEFTEAANQSSPGKGMTNSIRPLNRHEP